MRESGDADECAEVPKPAEGDAPAALTVGTGLDEEIEIDSSQESDGIFKERLCERVISYIRCPMHEIVCV